VPVAVTESEKLAPNATFVTDCGWLVIVGATTPEPLLEDDEDELELLELLLDDELEELEELLEPEDELEAGVVTLTLAV
jgi:hypothetical protein